MISVTEAFSPLDSSAFTEPAKVLVVDDDKSMRSVLMAILRHRGYETIGAENGLDAERLIASARPSLVVTDLNMPGRNGWELLSFCHEHYPDLPVLLISGGDLGLRPEVECWSVGFLEKPFSALAFHAAVDRHVARRAAALRN
jgi:DNA-binding NtrC family response regulator